MATAGQGVSGGDVCMRVYEEGRGMVSSARAGLTISSCAHASAHLCSDMCFLAMPMFAELHNEIAPCKC
jgi:hypothetical protein